MIILGRDSEDEFIPVDSLAGGGFTEANDLHSYLSPLLTNDYKYLRVCITWIIHDEADILTFFFSYGSISKTFVDLLKILLLFAKTPITFAFITMGQWAVSRLPSRCFKIIMNQCIATCF